MSLNHKLDQINKLRFDLRSNLIEKMKTNPNMKDSETLRLVENDISFWESQTDYSTSGLIITLNNSFKLN